MFCKKCGAEVKDNSMFRGQCGEKITYNTPTAQTVEKEKDKSNPITVIISFIIMIGIVLVIISGVKWTISGIGSLFDNKDGTGKQFTEKLDASSMISAVEITNIGFNASTGSISLDIQNVSDKDIAYINFDTYFYDRMGGKLKYYSDDFVTLNYTGPLYQRESTTVSYSYLFGMPSSTGVVYPRKITVTFFDDSEVTFDNTIYAYSDDYYGGKLKD